MNHLAIIQAEFVKEARKWDDLSIDDQRAYLRRHPKSKRRITSTRQNIGDKGIGKGKRSDELASKFIELHNQASKEYKQAFVKVNAKMWHDDDAHKLSEKSTAYISKAMSKQPMKNIGQIYIIARPLTVLDSYPNVTAAQRRQLDKEVDAIWKKYSRLWKNVLK